MLHIILSEEVLEGEEYEALLKEHNIEREGKEDIQESKKGKASEQNQEKQEHTKQPGNAKTKQKEEKQLENTKIKKKEEKKRKKANIERGLNSEFENLLEIISA